MHSGVTKRQYIPALLERVGAVPIGGVEIQHSGGREGRRAYFSGEDITIPYSFSESITIPYISRII
jgi:hypothetical protein